MLNLFIWSKSRNAYDEQYGTVTPSRVVQFRSKRRKASLGDLQRLPTEVINEIFMFLDLDALRIVLQINSTYFCLATNLPAYKLLRQYASQVLQIMHMTQTAGYFSLYQVFGEFCQPYCRTCGNFGAYIFLLNFTRCCLYCLTFSKDYALVPLFDVAVQHCLSMKCAEELVSIYTLPGTYRKEVRRRQRLVRLQDVLNLAIDVHGSIEKSRKASSTYLEGLRGWYNDSVADWRKQNVNLSSNPSRNKEAREKDYAKPRMPRELKVKPFTTEDPVKFDFMGSAMFPFWDTQKRVIETGIYCYACVYVPGSFYPSKEESRKATHRAYRIEELPQHFLGCSASRIPDKSKWYWNWCRGPPQIKGKPFLVKADGTIKASAPV